MVNGEVPKQEKNPFDLILICNDDGTVGPYDGYSMSNAIGSVHQDVIVRFYTRTKDHYRDWKGVFDTWRKKYHPYKEAYKNMEK